MKFDYLESLEQLGRADVQSPYPVDAWLMRAPWERMRTDRLLRLWTNENLAVVERAVQSLRNGTSLEWLQDAQLAESVDRRRQATPHIRMSLREFNAGNALSNTAAERAARRSATRVMLALAAYQLANGRLPESLEQLAATEGQALPKDPYTGLDFRYFPQGFPIRVPLNMGLGGDGAWTIPTGEVLLWSPGIQVRMTETQENGTLAPGYSMVNRERQFERVDDLQAWKSGITFLFRPWVVKTTAE